MNAITVKQNGSIKPDTDILGLVDDWHLHLKLQVGAGEISDLTRRAYMLGWVRFQDWLMAQDVVELAGDDIRRWIQSLEGYKSNSVNAWYAGVRAFFAWAVGNRRLLVNPCQGIKGARRKGTSRKHLRGVLTNAEVKRVLSQPDRSTAQGKRDYAILCLMAYTAVRSVEIARADLADLRSEGTQLVLYVQGKGEIEKDEFVVILGPAEDGLHDWISARGDKPGALFVSLSDRSSGERLSLSAIRHMVKGYYKAAGVTGKDKTTHSLRHTAITSAILGGAPVQKAQSMARHKNLDTTMIYFHEVDRLDDPAEGYINYDARARW